MSKRVIVTGASGLLGRALLKELKASGFDVLGLAFSRAKDGLVKVDLNKKDEVATILDDFKPAIVIHAAAQRAPDQFDSNFEESIKLNVEVSRTLAALCDQRKVYFILISTDYVFDGANPPYKETDKPSPINTYGKSKADAEEAVQKASAGKAIILRIPVLYGDEEKIGESAVSGLLASLLDSSSKKKVSSYEIRRPACTEDISFILARLAEKKIENPDQVKDVYQWCGSEELTKYDMVKAMGEVFNLPTGHIEADPSPGTGAPRPRDVTLSRARLEALGISKHTPFKQGIKKLFAKFIK